MSRLRQHLRRPLLLNQAYQDAGQVGSDLIVYFTYIEFRNRYNAHIRSAKFWKDSSGSTRAEFARCGVVVSSI